MHNARTTSGLTRANRRVRDFRCRGRVGPRRPGLFKVVVVVFNATYETVGAKKDGKYSAAALTAFGESLETLQGEVTSNIKHQTLKTSLRENRSSKALVTPSGCATIVRASPSGRPPIRWAIPTGGTSSRMG